MGRKGKIVACICREYFCFDFILFLFPTLCCSVLLGLGPKFKQIIIQEKAFWDVKIRVYYTLPP